MLDGVKLTQKHSGSIYEIPYQNKPTFNLPRLDTGDPVLGAEVAYIGQKTNGQLPNIKGNLANTAINYAGWSGSSGPFSITSFSAYASVGNITGSEITFNANRCSSVYTDGQTRVKSAGVYVMYCIKY